jgi:hypothetical protein
MNHRGRGARRGKNDPWLRVQGKGVPFSTFSGKAKLPRVFQKQTSAVSASSSFIPLDFLHPRSGERMSLIFKRRMEPQIAEMWEDAERRK